MSIHATVGPGSVVVTKLVALVDALIALRSSPPGPTPDGLLGELQRARTALSIEINRLAREGAGDTGRKGGGS